MRKYNKKHAMTRKGRGETIKMTSTCLSREVVLVHIFLPLVRREKLFCPETSTVRCFGPIQLVEHNVGLDLPDPMELLNYL